MTIEIKITAETREELGREVLSLIPLAAGGQYAVSQAGYAQVPQPAAEEPQTGEQQSAPAAETPTAATPTAKPGRKKKTDAEVQPETKPEIQPEAPVDAKPAELNDSVADIGIDPETTMADDRLAEKAAACRKALAALMDGFGEAPCRETMDKFGVKKISQIKLKDADAFIAALEAKRAEIKASRK